MSKFGVAVGIAQGDRIVFLGGYGWADRENEVPVDPSATSFRWASVSKGMAALTAAQAAADGTLDLHILDAKYRREAGGAPWGALQEVWHKYGDSIGDADGWPVVRSVWVLWPQARTASAIRENGCLHRRS